MRCFVRWGGAAVGAALLSGGAGAQLLPVAPPNLSLASPTAALPQLTAPALPAPQLSPGQLISAPSQILGSTMQLSPSLNGPLIKLGDSALLGQNGLALPLQAGATGGFVQRHGLDRLAEQRVSDDAAGLESERKRRVQELLRQKPMRLETDEQGNPVVRGKLVVLNATEPLLQRLKRSGYQILSTQVHLDLGIGVTELGVPAGLSAVQALRRLREVAPGAQADFDHLFRPAGG
jgi:hypothetical protein